MMEESQEEPTLLSAAVVSATTLGTVAKEPELVTILEDKLLTHDEIEQEQEQGETARYVDDEPTESTPLLRSIESDVERSCESSYCSQSQKSMSFSNSQASLFIPSIQFSLYSSRGHDFASKSGAMISRSAVISLPDMSNELSHSAVRSKSVTMSLLEKLSEDGQAPSMLAMWNMMNMILGISALFAMPYAISLGGFPALAALLLVGVICDRTAVYLVDCLYEVSPKSRLRKRVRGNYAEIAADAWGPKGGRLVDFVTVTLAFCICILMVMALGTSVLDLLKTVVSLDLQVWCLICTLALVPVVFIERLSVLAWLSMSAVVALIVCVIILLGFCIGEFNSWTIQNIPPFNADTFPISLGMIMYSYCGHAVFTGIEGSMREPRKYNRVTHCAFTIVTLTKLVVGFCCCLLFGISTKAIIIINISMSHKTILSSLITILLIFNTYLSYPLNMFVVSGTFDILLLPKFPACKKGQKYHVLWSIVTRTTLVFLSLAVALAVPHFGLLMGVFGSLLGACISIIFPCLLHMQLKWNKLTWFNVATESFIVLFGVIAAVLGLVYSCIALKNA